MNKKRTKKTEATSPTEAKPTFLETQEEVASSANAPVAAEQTATKTASNPTAASSTSSTTPTLNKYYGKAYNRGFPNKYGRKKRFCKLCAKGVEWIDYKDVDTLYKYLQVNLKIASRRITSACSTHQRRVTNAIKRARIMALIAFVKD